MVFLSIIVKLNTEKVVADGYADEKMTFWVRYNMEYIKSVLYAVGQD